MKLLSEKLLHAQAGLSDDGSQRAAREIARIAGDSGRAFGSWIEPDLMTAFGRPSEFKSVRLQSSHDIAVLERGQAAHAC